MVGYNNAGKTNILESIKWVLKKSTLKLNDFNNPETPVIVTAKIDGITETNKYMLEIITIALK